jgi:hypothetical protein
MMTFNKILAGLALVACVGATAPASAQGRYLASTKDQCQGDLYVEDKNGNKMPIRRGDWIDYNPKIRSGGTWGRCCGWRWWCEGGGLSRGSFEEWSRLGSTPPDTIKVWHDPVVREIIWWGYKDR